MVYDYCTPPFQCKWRFSSLGKIGELNGWFSSKPCLITRGYHYFSTMLLFYLFGVSCDPILLINKPRDPGSVSDSANLGLPLNHSLIGETDAISWQKKMYKFGVLNPQCGNGSKSGSPHPQRWDDRASQLATCSERASGSPGNHAATVSSMPWESKRNACIYILHIYLIYIYYIYI